MAFRIASPSIGPDNGKGTIRERACQAGIVKNCKGKAADTYHRPYRKMGISG